RLRRPLACASGLWVGIATAPPAPTAAAGWRRRYGPAEMIGYIGFGAEQPLLFARPQRQPNRPPRLNAQRLQDADGFERDAAADGVVGCTGSAVPGVKMPAEHD